MVADSPPPANHPLRPDRHRIVAVLGVADVHIIPVHVRPDNDTLGLVAQILRVRDPHASAAQERARDHAIHDTRLGAAGFVHNNLVDARVVRYDDAIRLLDNRKASEVDGAASREECGGDNDDEQGQKHVLHDVPFSPNKGK